MNQGDLIKLFELLKIDKITPTDQWVNGRCPFAPFSNKHKSNVDRRPSFGVSVGRQSHYYCFTCHASNPVQLLVTNLGFLRKKKLTAARRWVSDHESFELEPFETMEQREPLHVLPPGMIDRYDDLDKRGLRFLAQRKMHSDTIAEFNLRYDPKQNRLMIPVYNGDGYLVGMRGRALFEGAYAKYRAYVELNPGNQDPKRHGVWFGQHLRPSRTQKIILTEGELDAMMLWQALKRPVWSSMGAQISKAQIETIKAYGNPVVMFMDDDEAGRDTTIKLIRKIEKFVAGVHRVTMYSGCKDPAEIVARGKKYVKRAFLSMDRVA